MANVQANVEVSRVEAVALPAVVEVALPAVAEAVLPAVAEAVIVQNMAGAELATFSPVPPNVLELKRQIEAQTSIPVALQKLIESEGVHIYRDSESLSDKFESGTSLKVIMVVDQTPLFSWDVASNPGKDALKLEGGSIITCPQLHTDYVNVLTREPIRNGSHYFEFVMHFIGDEQWCGVVTDPKQAGPRCGGRSLKGWTYYCGRMRSGSGSIVDGKGCLHAEGKAVKEFKKLKCEGDIIGMLVDLDAGAIAFDLNGELQGACAIPKDTPMWVLTHVDTPKDKVELRKPCLMDAPPANLEALKGALLDISSGTSLRGY